MQRAVQLLKPLVFVLCLFPSIAIFHSSNAMPLEDKKEATVGSPAVFSIAAQKTGGEDLILSLSWFRPPAEGALEGVAFLVDPSGKRIEAGRFGFFPNEEFSSKAALGERKYRLPVSKSAQELIASGARLEVELRPIKGQGEGAAAEFAGVSLAK
jgi:hypothetical protein